MDDELKPDLSEEKLESIELPKEPFKVEPREFTPEEFYGNEDSVYIRVKYFKETDAFKFDVKSEIIEQNYKEDEPLPQSIVSLTAFVRGMLEFALHYPHQMYRVGNQAMQADMIANMGDLTDEQKKLLMGNTEGSA